MSFDSLLKRKVRTILTILGVIIGTISIVVMMSLGIGMKQSMLAEVETYGSLTAVTVEERWMDGGEKNAMHLDDNLVEQLSCLEHVEFVDPRLCLSVMSKVGRYQSYTELTGMSPAGFDKLNIQLADGEIPKDSEELSLLYGNQMILSYYDEHDGYSDYYQTGIVPDIDFMNDSIFTILDTESYWGGEEENKKPPKKHLFKTAGVVAGDFETYSNASWGLYCNIDALKKTLKKEFKNRAIPDQPLKDNGKPYKEIFYSQIIVYADSMENVKELQQTITDMGYEAYSDSEWIEEEMKTINIIQAVLGAIGAVSLLVAAIGIANTMMMSIYERTKEIGIMKVIGCSIKDIQAMFLMEAGYIGLIGGFIGLALSYLLSFGINKFLGSSDMSSTLGVSGKISIIPVWLSALSIVFAVLIGMISGFIPSLRAMKLTPLTAIRNE